MKKILLAAVAAMAVSSAGYAGESAFGDLSRGASAAGAASSAPQVPKVSAASPAVSAAIQALAQSEEADILFLKEKGIEEGGKLLPARHYQQKGIDRAAIKADLENLELLLDARPVPLKALAEQYKIAVKQAEKIDCLDEELMASLVKSLCKVFNYDISGSKGVDCSRLDDVFNAKNRAAQTFWVNAYAQLVQPELQAAIQNLLNTRKFR